MKYIWRLSCMFVLVARLTWAQTGVSTTSIDPVEFETGNVPYSTHDLSNVGTVNLATGSLLINIPLLSFPEAGSLPPFEVRLVGRSSVWVDIHNYNSFDEWLPYPDLSTMFSNTGTHVSSGIGNRYTVLSQASYLGSDINGNPVYGEYSVAKDIYDTTHLLTPWPAMTSAGVQVNSMSVDGSALANTTTVINNPNNFSLNVIDSSGITYSSWYTSGYTRSVITDPNGNQATYNNTNGPNSDSVPGRAALPMTDTLPAGDCYPLTYPAAPPASSSTLTICTTTKIAYSGISGPYTADNGTGIYEISSVTLPNGQSWQFSYNSFGDVDTITMPTGATTHFDYASVQDPLSPTDTFRQMVTAKTIQHDGQTEVWQYLYGASNGVPGTIATTVRDPNGNDTVHLFDPSSGVEIEADYFNGPAPATLAYGGTCPNLPSAMSGLVKSELTHYNYYSFRIASSPIPQNKQTYWPATGQLSQTSYSYPTDLSYIDHNWEQVGVDPAPQYAFSTGLKTLVQDTDYGSCAPGSVLRTTNTTYKAFSTDSNAMDYLTANLLSYPTEVIVSDGSGTVARTDISYDESPSPSGPHGNLTTKKGYIDASSYITTSAQYNTNGSIAQTTDGNGNTTVISYQCGTFPYQSTLAGQTHEIDRDCGSGLTTATKDPNDLAAGRSGTTYQYDSMNNVTSANYPDGGNKSIDYHGYVTPLTVTATTAASPDPAIVTNVLYDGLARPVRGTDGASDVTLTAYDPLGRVCAQSNPTLSAMGSGLLSCSASSNPSPIDSTDGITYIAYDPISRKTGLTLPDGNTQQWSYSGNTTTFTDENSNQWQQMSDGLGRLTQVTEPGALLTNYSYDALGNLTGAVQNGTRAEAEGRTRSFLYDGLSRLIQAYNPETGWVCYGTTGGSAPNGSNCTSGYDGNGNMTTKTDARGVVSNYHYDALNRIYQKDYVTAGTSATATPTVNYVYDSNPNFATQNAIGRLTSETIMDASSNLIFERAIPAYDAMGRVAIDSRCVSVLCPTLYPVTYTYDSAGNEYDALVSYMNISGVGPMSMAYRYDNAGRFRAEAYYNLAASIQGILISDITYSPFGTIAAANDFETRTYDSRARLKSINFNVAQYGLANYSSTYDYYPNGNLQDNTDSVNGTWSYNYDSLNRVQSATVTPVGGSTPSTSTYAYDSFGNRTSQSGIMLNAETYLNPTNQADCIPNVPGSAGCYDAAGNQTRDINLYTANTYSYDAEGRLSGVNNGGAPYTYLYDGEGNRIVEYLSGAPHKEYLREANSQFYAPLDGTGLANSVEFFGGGRHIMTISNDYYLPALDALGTERIRYGLLNSTAQNITSLPFGDGMNYSGTDPSPLHFTGKERDAESGLDYFGARYMSSAMGRFMSPDPTGLAYADITNPQSLNLYSYVLNNPLTNVDPTGTTCQTNSSDGNTYDDGDGQGCEVVDDQNAQYAAQHQAAATVYADDSSNVLTSSQSSSQTVSGQNVSGNGSAPSRGGCMSQRVYSGLMGAANLGIAAGKAIALPGAVAAAGVTGAGAPAAGVLGVYGTVSIFGQSLAGSAQVYSAFTGSYGTSAKIAQFGNILAGPVSGLGTLMRGGSMEAAERNAGYESLATAASSVIDAINAGASGLPLALSDNSAAYLGAFGSGGNPCGAGH